MGLCFGKDGSSTPTNNNNNSQKPTTKGTPANNRLTTTDPAAQDEMDEENNNNGNGSGQYDVKLLLLGSGESGKSTFFKQVRIITQRPFTDIERRRVKPTVYFNVLSSMALLCQKARDLGLTLDREEHNQSAERIIQLSKNRSFHGSLNSKGREGEKNFYTEEIAQDMQDVWSDSQIQSVFTKYRGEVHIFDGADYFFSQLDKIKQQDYLPTEEDIIHCRQKTVGIIEVSFEHEGLKFSLFDVGGQRSERKKWVNCFEGVSAVVYVSSLADYDLKMYEDDTLNRMDDSMTVFEGLCNGFFKETPIIIVQNKTDIFKQKLQVHGIDCCFSEYKGTNDFRESMDYIREKFLALNKFDEERIWVHEVCATNTDDVRQVFEKIKHQVADWQKKKSA